MSPENDPPETMQDLDDYGDKMLSYYRRYILYCRGADTGRINPNSLSSPDRMSAIGNNVRLLRKVADIPKEVLAQELGVDVYQLTAFEVGILSSLDLQAGFVNRLVEILTEKITQR